MNIEVTGQDIRVRIDDPELERLLMGNPIEAQAVSASGDRLRSSLHPVASFPGGLSAEYAGQHLRLQVSLENLVYFMRMRPDRSELTREVGREGMGPLRVSLVIGE